MEPRPRQGRNATPVFVTGSLLRHILVMTSTGAAGLVAIFVGDLANIFFLGLLGDEAVIAAVGYASSVLLLTISIGIGLAIAATALVAPALGAGHVVKARRLSTNAHLWTAGVSAVMALGVWLAIPWLLTLLGASGRTHTLAAEYLMILVPGLPPLALAMTSSAVLRSAGDAKRAMHVTLSGAITNIVLDPIFIFALGLGIHGAAIASLMSRAVVLAVGLNGVMRVHGLYMRPRRRPFLADGPRLANVAVPAILTNVATPFANAYVTAAMAPFGDSAVAGWAIIGRILPVAFGAIYALSGSVGPIIGQNYGARAFDRMRTTLGLALAVTAAFTTVAWLLLIPLAGPLARSFRASAEATDLIALFCVWLSPLFVFLGALFVANAVFNTLGRPHYSTMLNWGRATIGTIPFVEIGARWGGAEGVLVANMVGAIVFGTLAIAIGYRLIDWLAENGGPPGSGPLRQSKAPEISAQSAPGLVDGPPSL
ncbi:MAG: MATE family efflux transporter [Pseudomonadota bacterium]